MTSPCLHTASETFVHHKIIRIRFDFLRFCIRSMHFDRKGWRIWKKRKNACENLGLCVQWPLDCNSSLLIFTRPLPFPFPVFISSITISHFLFPFYFLFPFFPSPLSFFLSFPHLHPPSLSGSLLFPYSSSLFISPFRSPPISFPLHFLFPFQFIPLPFPVLSSSSSPFLFPFPSSPHPFPLLFPSLLFFLTLLISSNSVIVKKKWLRRSSCLILKHRPTLWRTFKKWASLICQPTSSYVYYK